MFMIGKRGGVNFHISQFSIFIHASSGTTQGSLQVISMLEMADWLGLIDVVLGRGIGWIRIGESGERGGRFAWSCMG